MKQLLRKFRFPSPAKIALAGVLVLALSLPAQLPAQQDIDDVIGDLDKDFSLGGKDEIKQGNKELANEQNREDIRILEEERLQAEKEEEMGSTPGSVSAATSATVTFNLTASSNDADVSIIFGSLGTVFSGTITTGMPLNLVIPNVPVGPNILSITCQSSTPGPNCNISLSGLVNTTCVPLTIPPIPASPSVGSSSCNVTAP